jgi:2-polyprenyl-3-methyl-5-hydroxy-6-metoxy-1,4-benzoquinol methylase
VLVDKTPAKLENVVADSDAAWKTWGERDPYFGVLTDDKFRADAIDSHVDEFFQSGEEYIADRLARAEAYFGPVPRRRALDFGCGVGRLAIPLASRFEEVVGLDISTAMLAESTRNAQARGIANAAFVLSDDTLSSAPGPYDFVHTYIVLQHIPVSRGLFLIDRLLDMVAPGGVASLHMTVDRNNSPLQAMQYWAVHNLYGVQGLFNLIKGRAWSEPGMQMNAYPLSKVLAHFARRGFGDVIINTEMHGRIMGAHVLARRNLD